MSQKLPVNGFEWIKNISQLSEDLAKNYNEEKDEGYFPEVDVQYLEKLHEFCNDLPFFFQKEWSLKESKKLLLIYMIKLNMLFT